MGNLETVTCLAENIPETHADAFKSTYILNLIVPESSLEAYKATAPWSNASSFSPYTTSDVKAMTANAQSLLITQSEGILIVSGLQNGDVISAYSIDGKNVATSKAIGNAALLNLSELQGKVAVLNVAGKSAKVMVK